MPASDMTIALTEPHPGVLQVLMDRPGRLNALNLDLVSALDRAVADHGGPVVVLGSTAPASFSAGVDVKAAESERAEVSRSLYRLYETMRASPAVLIAAAQGHAIGGGAQLMIACDLRVVGPDVSIRFMGPGHGLAVGAWRLPGLVGRGRALEIMLSMRAVGADEALAIGLVDRIDPAPLDRALELARHIAGLSGEAVTALKRIASMTGEEEALRSEGSFNSRWPGTFPEGRASDG